MLKQWYILKNDVETGPFDKQEIFLQVQKGIFAPDDMIRKENTPQWHPLGNVKGLFPKTDDPATSHRIEPDDSAETMERIETRKPPVVSDETSQTTQFAEDGKSKVVDEKDFPAESSRVDPDDPAAVKMTLWRRISNKYGKLREKTGALKKQDNADFRKKAIVVVGCTVTLLLLLLIVIQIAILFRNESQPVSPVSAATEQTRGIVLDFSGRPGSFHTLTPEEWDTILTTEAPVNLKLSYTDTTDDDLKKLVGLNIQSLNLRGCEQITDIGLVFLEGMTQLQSLWLSNCYQITDAGLVHLRKMTQLQTLDLNFCYKITDLGLAFLKGMTQLRSLNLGGCRQITDIGLVFLEGITQLQSLDLGGCEQITDLGLAHLKEMLQLQELKLYGCRQITDTGFVHLKEMTQLRSLNLMECRQITDTGFVHLKGMTQLRSLNLMECGQITDAGLTHLMGMTQLQSLILFECVQITDDGIESLQKQLPDCVIER